MATLSLERLRRSAHEVLAEIGECTCDGVCELVVRAVNEFRLDLAEIAKDENPEAVVEALLRGAAEYEVS
tara:strand:+ start:654 stop:863 length:210 start_codon:yes stop_codon:yes gene_type:complete